MLATSILPYTATNLQIEIDIIRYNFVNQFLNLLLVNFKKRKNKYKYHGDTSPQDEISDFYLKGKNNIISFAFKENIRRLIENKSAPFIFTMPLTPQLIFYQDGLSTNPKMVRHILMSTKARAAYENVNRVEPDTVGTTDFSQIGSDPAESFTLLAILQIARTWLIA